jgi:hypothetical protein
VAKTLLFFTRTDPTRLLVQVDRVETSRAISIKYFSQLGRFTASGMAFEGCESKAGKDYSSV